MDPDENHSGGCAAWMRNYLGIESRAELDGDSAVADQFHADIRKPYAKWFATHG